MKKKTFDADYNIKVAGEDGNEVNWMLLDAVGSFWDSGYKYYLKHRAPGQVDAEGKATSTVLGAVDMQGDYDAFSFKVSGADRDVDFGPYFDMWDGDIDWGVSQEKSIWAIWTYSKRAILYSDYEMTQQIGWLDITGSGTWHEWEEQRTVYDTDDDGHQQMRIEYEHHQDCRTQSFQYQMNVFNTPMTIRYAHACPPLHACVPPACMPPMCRSLMISHGCMHARTGTTRCTAASSRRRSSTSPRPTPSRPTCPSSR